MNLNVLPISVCVFLFMLVSCSTKPDPIKYGDDQCAACKMMIVDQRFGAELVTQKGKIYKYDAAECMIRTLLENGEEQYEHILVTDFDQPTTLIDAKTSMFLISPALPSPMGGNLSAYASKDQGVNALVNMNGNGQLYDWENLQKEYANSTTKN